jgi:hypothetical protein
MLSTGGGFAAAPMTMMAGELGMEGRRRLDDKRDNLMRLSLTKGGYNEQIRSLKFDQVVFVLYIY